MQSRSNTSGINECSSVLKAGAVQDHQMSMLKAGAAQDHQMSILQARLAEVLKNVSDLGNKVQIIADRTFGSMPEQEGRDKEGLQNSGTVSQLHGLITNIEASLISLHGQINRLERL